MKVYLAAPWVCRAQVVDFQNAFEAAGFTVTAHWIKRHHAAADYLCSLFSDNRYEALEDLRDIDAADALVIYNLEKSEGKATEFGYAVGRGKAVILVGENSRNLFYFLPHVQHVKTTDEAIRLLTGT